jgi:hypothetical protein
MSVVVPDKDSKGNIVHKQGAFASKDNLHFRGQGLKHTIAGGDTYSFDYVIPHAQCEFNGVEILYAEGKDVVNLKILDTSTGTYSTIPDFILDQFGTAWNVSKEVCIKELDYNATLYQGMRIVVEYTNNHTAAVEIAVNLNIHKVG